MYKIYVVNVRSVQECEVVHRPSALGNPWPIGPNANRNLVCDHYEEWFHERIEFNDKIVIHEVKRLHRIGKDKGIIRLGCFCKPMRCHGDTIAHFLEHNYDLLEEWIQ